MEKPLSNTKFVFYDPIDGEYLIDLYAGDYNMIEETFTDVLREYDDFVERIITTYHEGDVVSLKSAVHKVKPLFGFVGLTALQAQCLDFETACQKAGSAAGLAPAFEALRRQLTDSKSIIASELARLSVFNRG